MIGFDYDQIGTGQFLDDVFIHFSTVSDIADLSSFTAESESAGLREIMGNRKHLHQQTGKDLEDDSGIDDDAFRADVTDIEHGTCMGKDFTAGMIADGFRGFDVIVMGMRKKDRIDVVQISVMYA